MGKFGLHPEKTLMGVPTKLLVWIWRNDVFDAVVKRWILPNLPPEVLLKLAVSTGSALDEDLDLLPLLCKKDRASVDVGAHFGLYTHHMSRHSKCVYAFEPMARYAASLRRSFSKNVVVENAGLSNSSGKRTLRTPANNRTMATMEEKNALPYALKDTKILEEEIVVKRLDDCGIADIGFIKVDAEGHELEVLQGASATLKKDSPALLIELVDSLRPNTIRDVNEFLKSHGYQGYSLRERVLYPIEKFDPEQLQKQENVSTYGRRGVYFSNFVFVRPEGKAGLKDYLDPGSTA